MGYPEGFLETRAVVKHGQYAVVPPEGRVINVVPGFEGFKLSILASPKMGAGFVWYVGEVEPGATTTKVFGGDGVETFVYFMDGEGELTVTVGGKDNVLKQGGYVFAPADLGMEMKNNSKGTMRIILYKQLYIPLEGHEAKVVVGNANDVEEVIYDGMENVFLKDLLPTDDLGFDMNMHFLSFEPAGCHPFIETHVQEHGAYLVSGQGFYYLGQDWIQVQKEDFLWMGAFTEQGCYGTGRERLTYIYSKDCNRDVEL